MKAIDDTQLNENNKQLEIRLKEEREEWRRKIEDVIKSIPHNNKLTEAQVYLLSYREQILELIVLYKTALEKSQESYDKQRVARFREYSTQYDIKLSGSEKSAFISADLSAMRLKISMIQSQIEFFTESIKTVDNAAYFVKNRLTIITEEIV